jgi:hypothetical protein
MNPQTVTDVERFSTELAHLRHQVGQLLGRLADTELQLGDVRSERDQEHQLAEEAHRFAQLLQAALDNSVAIAEGLQSALAASAAVEQAKGIVAQKAGVSVTEAHDLLRGYSRDKSEKLRVIAAAVVAAQDPATPHDPGHPDPIREILAGGIPREFWESLTLNGAIFE